MPVKIDRNNILEHLVEKHLGLIDKTILDALFTKDWKKKWYISKTKEEEFRKYTIPLMKKVFKFNKKKALENYEWFMKNFGLTIKDRTYGKF